MIAQRVDVTIAIACYNQAQYLEQAIKSCLRQTRAAADIIVVDDGSHDHTREVASRFGRVRYVHQDNAGLSAARNTGLRLATTSRILFLDADDWLAPVALEAATAAFERQPLPPAFVHGSYQEVDEHGAVQATHLACQRSDPFRDLLRGNYVAMHGTVLYDAAVLRSSQGFDVRMRSCEDYDVYLRLARHHPVGTYPEVAACYRRHASSLSRDRFAMIETALAVIDRHASGGAPSDEDRAAASIGRHVMIDYYLGELMADVSRDRRSGARKLVVSAIRRPRVALQLLGSLIGRWTRAATTTG